MHNNQDENGPESIEEEGAVSLDYDADHHIIDRNVDWNCKKNLFTDKFYILIILISVYTEIDKGNFLDLIFL